MLSAEEQETYANLRAIVAKLRAPDGCPWDREQTHLSLRPYVLEEAYEVVGALDAEDLSSLPEELGDLLLQIVLHSQLADCQMLLHFEDALYTRGHRLCVVGVVKVSDAPVQLHHPLHGRHGDPKIGGGRIEAQRRANGIRQGLIPNRSVR